MKTERQLGFFFILSAFVISCAGGQRGSTQALSDERTPSNAGASPDATDNSSAPDVPTLDPAVAQAIRSLDWRSVNCSGRSALNRLLRLEFSPEQGWSCRIAHSSFADVTHDGVEEAVVSLEFQLTSVERQANGTLSERRLRSNEHVVVALHNDQPELLVHIVSDQGDISDVEVVDGDLKIELQGCWDCGCDIYEEYWVWNGHHFDVDESRSRQLYEVPNCTP